MTVVNALDLEKISTKSFAEVLDRFELKKALIVVDGENAKLELSARNLPFVKVLRAEGVNVYDVLKYPNLVMTEGAVDQIEGALAK
jgi:large subunit ribosomal protein L4